MLALLALTYYIVLPLKSLWFLPGLGIIKPKLSIVSLNQIISKVNLPGLFVLQALKFSFSGKGYKLIFNKNLTVTFNFGHSHLYYLYNRKVIPQLVSKTRGYFVGLNSFLLKQTTLSLKYSKPINLFTGRGVRLTKQAIYKKVGKVSMYM